MFNLRNRAAEKKTFIEVSNSEREQWVELYLISDYFITSLQD